MDCRRSSRRWSAGRDLEGPPPESRLQPEAGATLQRAPPCLSLPTPALKRWDDFRANAELRPGEPALRQGRVNLKAAVGTSVGLFCLPHPWESIPLPIRGASVTSAGTHCPPTVGMRQYCRPTKTSMSVSRERPRAHCSPMGEPLSPSGSLGKSSSCWPAARRRPRRSSGPLLWAFDLRGIPFSMALRSGGPSYPCYPGLSLLSRRGTFSASLWRVKPCRRGSHRAVRAGTREFVGTRRSGERRVGENPCRVLQT